MATQEEDKKGAFRERVGAAKSLQRTLSQMREVYSDAPRIEVRLTETQGGKYEGEGSTGTSARLVIIIVADTADHAFEHAKSLEDQGCICISSGETEVTCDCTDIH